MMSAVEHKFDDVNVEDFIKQFTTTDSPARPQLLDYGSQFPHFSHSESSPPYEGIGLSDLSGSSHSSEWLQNLDNIGLDSTLTPSSRGSSLETPSLPQNSTLIGSINPSRLKEVAAGKMASYPEHEGEVEPVWAMPVQVIPSNPLPTFAPSGLNPAGDEAFTTPTPKASAQSKRATRKHDEMDDGTTPSKRIRRMSSLPEIYIPVVQQPVPRVLQRSASSGGIILPSQDDGAGSPFFKASPLEAPMSAPIPQQAQFTSYQMPVNPATSVPTMHARSYSNYSSLATIPEAPSSAPADVQWATVPQQVHQHVQQQQQQQQYQEHQQPHQYQQQAQPQQQPQHFQQQHPQSALGFQYGNVQDASAYVPPTTASTMHSPALQSPMPPATPSLPSNMAGPKPPVAPSLPPNMGVSRPVMTHQHTLSASAIMPGGRQIQQQFRAYPQHVGNNTPNFGMGRPQPAHLRRSSDTELAFGTQGNVGAMLRSTSVPQGPGAMNTRPATAGGIYQPQQLPPPPPIGTNFTYQPSAIPLTPYPEHVQTQPGVPPNYGQIAIGRPAPAMTIGRPVPTVQTMMPVTMQQQQQQQQQQQRKRVSSKRVGQCLKPGPKGKNKNKPDAIASAISSGATLPGGASSSVLHLGPSGPNVLTGRSTSVATQPANMVPVTFDEFCAAFNRTPRGTLVPTPAMDMLIERLMYATDDTVVDACFRWCYTIGTEFNKAAQKQSKYFKCSFEECADSAQRIFMRKSAVDSHVRTHIGYRPYKCEVDVWCEARFVRKHDRDRHTQTTHKNEKSFECADCKQNFARSDALLRHRAKRDACKARIG